MLKQQDSLHEDTHDRWNVINGDVDKLEHSYFKEAAKPIVCANYKISVRVRSQRKTKRLW